MKNLPLLAFLVSIVLALSAAAQPVSSSRLDPDQNGTPAAQSDPQDSSTVPNTSLATSTQDQRDTQEQNNEQRIPVYRVQVVERTTQAVDYRDRGGTTQVNFQGTSIMPKVTGEAHVTGHTGRLEIKLSLHHLEKPRTFGPAYLTYVLWGISPEGRPANLGEVIPNDDGDSDVQVTTGLQEFGMIVTAEPYFAVTRPSDLVIAENIVRSDTEGNIRPISARYELLQKGQYFVSVSPDQLPATTADRHTPLQLLEAENAVAIAQASGAEQYAPETMEKARQYLNQARDYYLRKQGRTPIGTVARAAAETAEDARLMTLEKKQQEQTAAERQRAQERIRMAQSQADANAARADEASIEARREAEARALSEQERQAAEQARVEAEQAAQEAAQERAAAQQQLQQAEQARQAAVQEQQQYQQQAQQAQAQAQQAEQARMQTEQQARAQRERLLNQLNQVLQTRETARGLIVNMSDVLFDLNQATLKPGAKLRLAKVAGIILAYPDLKLEIDGFTDSTGTPEYNQNLSERRAQSVQTFLVEQGVKPEDIVTHGYGESNPVASNGTAAGRQLNRRVELVVNGAAIGSNNTQGNAAGTQGTAPGVTSNPAAQPNNGTAVSPNAPSSPANVNGTGTGNVVPQSSQPGSYTPGTPINSGNQPTLPSSPPATAPVPSSTPPPR